MQDRDIERGQEQDRQQQTLRKHRSKPGIPDLAKGSQKCPRNQDATHSVIASRSGRGRSGGALVSLPT